MKKILFTIALVFTLSVANAQNDGFFKWNSNIDDNERGAGIDFYLPSAHGTGNDYNATPLGSGIVILTVLGAGYAMSRRRKK